MTHICVSKLSIIGSDNGLSPGRRQAIIWTSAGILVIEPLGTNFSEILIENRIFSFKKMYLKISSGKWRPYCLGLNVLKFGRTRVLFCCPYYCFLWPNGDKCGVLRTGPALVDVLMEADWESWVWTRGPSDLITTNGTVWATTAQQMITKVTYRHSRSLIIKMSLLPWRLTDLHR